MTYYYRHTNGEIHKKQDLSVMMGGGPLCYFDSPFVDEWWFEADPSDTRRPQVICGCHYTMTKTLDNGRLCGVTKLLFHWTLHIGIDDMGYQDRYCYDTQEAAEMALALWNGAGDPLLWHRHPKSGRRRDLKNGREWTAF